MLVRVCLCVCVCVRACARARACFSPTESSPGAVRRDCPRIANCNDQLARCSAPALQVLMPHTTSSCAPGLPSGGMFPTSDAVSSPPPLLCRRPSATQDDTRQGQCLWQPSTRSPSSPQPHRRPRRRHTPPLALKCSPLNSCSPAWHMARQRQCLWQPSSCHPRPPSASSSSSSSSPPSPPTGINTRRAWCRRSTCWLSRRTPRRRPIAPRT